MEYNIVVLFTLIPQEVLVKEYYGSVIYVVKRILYIVLLAFRNYVLDVPLLLVDVQNVEI